MKNNLRHSIALSSLLLLSGCTLAPVDERVKSDAVEFADNHLTPKDGYSVPLQQMNVVTQARPIHENNLDNFYIGRKYHNVSNAALGFDIAGVVLGSLNPLEFGAFAALNMMNRTSIHGLYRNNIMVVVEPVVDGDVKAALKRAKDRSIEIIRNAYSSIDVDSKVYLASDLGHINPYDQSLIALFDKKEKNKAVYCSNPDAYRVIEETQKYSYDDLGCYASVFGEGDMFLNNTENTLFPIGNFITMFSSLPSITPFEKLTSTSEYDWVYQPSFSFLPETHTRNIAINNKIQIVDHYNNGRLNENPSVTMLKSGKRTYFNKKAQEVAI
ncbi:hypothetical protein [Photobacterium sanguinicancri]|uniref:Lipoprotein n=1 Tax=Photobacterium sanguinicancri TaxID=875932 RepID=A0ABX4FZQ3_9GAMM|nr:hypothetical protein [Photobacterium sanguinicancri]OZS44351.1 hypothetical protein ASV53_08710 [Photobacterium sanguinicancri]